MTSNAPKKFQVREAFSGNGKLLIVLAIVMFTILPLNAQISISEAKSRDIIASYKGQSFRNGATQNYRV